MQAKLESDAALTYDDLVRVRDGRRCELVEGELRLSLAPTPLHQTISRRLQFELMQQIEETGIAYVFDAPCDVILGPGTVVEPDLVLLSQKRKDLISTRGIEGPPDVLVEILSPGTAGDDRGFKRELYARHGVREYWLVQPDAGLVEVHVLAGRSYRLGGRFDRAATLRSDVFDEISIPLGPIFRPH